MPVWSIVLLVIIAILVVALIALIIVGNKLRKKQIKKQDFQRLFLNRHLSIFREAKFL